MPFLLILATKMSVAAAEVSSELFVGKLRAPGPDGRRVATVLYKELERRTQKTSFRVMAWIIFDKHLEDRDGAFFTATVRYLGWTGNNVRVVTSDLDSQEDCFCRCLLNTATIGYLSNVQHRTTRVSYSTKVDSILKKAEGLPEYNRLKILRDVPEMTGNEITEAITGIEGLKNAKRALNRWKKLFSAKISQISKGHIASDVGRNTISRWLATVGLADSWISLMDQLKRLHQELSFAGDEAPDKGSNA